MRIWIVGGVGLTKDAIDCVYIRQQVQSVPRLQQLILSTSESCRTIGWRAKGLESPRSKQIKVVFDGKGYWLLWHWEDLVSPVAPAAPLASGPFPTIEQANKVASDAEKDYGWTVIAFSTRS